MTLCCTRKILTATDGYWMLFLKNIPKPYWELFLIPVFIKCKLWLHEKGWKLAGLVGYDLLHKNTEFLKTGEVTFLIGQRPSLQGYCGVKTLCNHVVFKRPVTAVKYMPIDILMKENIDFYFEFE